MRDVISDLHPVVSFMYFAFVLAFAMYFTNPAMLIISLMGALCYSIVLKGKKAAGFGLKFMLPMVLIVSVMNPVFNHQGATILTYLWDDNPLTLESIVYGVFAGCMLVTVICWFSCFNVVITSDKIIYLFGRIIPAMSLILSMTLRFVPRFKAQFHVVTDAQRCVGRDISCGKLLRRANYGVQILSIMVSWALENAIDTADSMKSRGYGLKGRTAFSNFRFNSRDRSMLTAVIVLAGFIIAGAVTGELSFRYYPTIKGEMNGIFAVFLYLDYAVLCILPVILNVREDKRWKALHSVD